MTWLKYITDTPWNKHTGIIHKKYKWIHSEVTITLTLPLNEEGILLTKFISTSLLLCIIWIIIESSSSSSHLHLDLDYHLIWIIITRSGSSLDLDHLCWINITRSGSSLDLDHDSWITITWYGSSLGHHHRCYLIILLVTRSSTEPALFHVGCRPSLHVGLLPVLISDPKS